MYIIYIILYCFIHNTCGNDWYVVFNHILSFFVKASPGWTPPHTRSTMPNVHSTQRHGFLTDFAISMQSKLLNAHIDRLVDMLFTGNLDMATGCSGTDSPSLCKDSIIAGLRLVNKFVHCSHRHMKTNTWQWQMHVGVAWSVLSSQYVICINKTILLI